MKQKTVVILILISILGFILRFYKITEFPPCLNWDEASLSYNAYSILKTGRDEYGKFLPGEFKSVGDYKYPFYVYSLVPIIKIFGLNEISARVLPSLAGTFAIILVYLISYSIFRSNRISLIASLFFAISPWNIQFARSGTEATYSLFFILLGLWGLVESIRYQKNLLIMATIAFILSIYTYSADRIFVPLIIFAVVLYFKKEIVKKWNEFKKILILSILLGIPIIFTFFTSGQQEKFFKTTIFGYNRPQEYETQTLNQDKSKIVFELFHNKFEDDLYAFADHYLNHFSPTFLFIEGAVKDVKQSIFDMGMLYFFDLPLLIVGLFKIIRKKSKYETFIIIWLLIAPIPSAITRDTVTSRRSLNMIVPLALISAVGLDYLWEKYKKIISKILRFTTVILSLGIFVYSFSFYLLSYTVFSPHRSYKGAGTWQCGYKELVSTIQKYKNKYKNIVIDTSYQGPYIFFLFYEKYDPKFYQPQARLIQRSPDELGEGAGYDNYTFRDIYWPNDRLIGKTLFVGPPERLPLKDIKEGQAKLIDTVYFSQGGVAFYLVETL